VILWGKGKPENGGRNRETARYCGERENLKTAEETERQRDIVVKGKT
jgi:hypothetical protein